MQISGFSRSDSQFSDRLERYEVETFCWRSSHLCFCQNAVQPGSSIVTAKSGVDLLYFFYVSCVFRSSSSWEMFCLVMEVS